MRWMLSCVSAMWPYKSGQALTSGKHCRQNGQSCFWRQGERKARPDANPKHCLNMTKKNILYKPIYILCSQSTLSEKLHIHPSLMAPTPQQKKKESLPGVTKECFLEALEYFKTSKQHPLKTQIRLLVFQLLLVSAKVVFQLNQLLFGLLVVVSVHHSHCCALHFFNAPKTTETNQELVVSSFPTNICQWKSSFPDGFGSKKMAMTGHHPNLYVSFSRGSPPKVPGRCSEGASGQRGVDGFAA